MQLLLFVITYLLTITLPPSKLGWYDAPIFPAICIGITIILWDITAAIQSAIQRIIVLAFILLVVGFKVVDFNKQIKGFTNLIQPEEQVATALKKFENKYYNETTFNCIMDSNLNKQVLLFYKKMYAIKNSINVNILDTLNSNLVVL